VLTRLAIPWHDAPAEAEAECAKMEVEGLVDAVWSEDGEALAYGSRTVIKSYREIKPTNDRIREPKHTYFEVYKLEDIEEKYPGMNREGFILHALLCRAGKLSGGLPDFDAGDALEAAQNGLGRSVLKAATSKAEFQDWVNSELKNYLEERMSVDFRDYPTYEQLKGYVSPAVSAKETLSSLLESKSVFDNDKEVYLFINKHLRWMENKWVRWIVPMRIVQLLAATRPGEERQHDHYKLESDDLNKHPKNPKATFLIRQATTLDMPCINPRAEFRTLARILLKANLNRTPTLHTLWGTPKSGQKSGASFGKAVDDGGDPSGASEMRPQTPPTPPSSAEDERLMLTQSTGYRTPTSNERVHDNGEGPSKPVSRANLRTPRTSSSSSRSKRPLRTRVTNEGLQTPVSNERNPNNGEASMRALESRAAQQSSPTPAPKKSRSSLNSPPKMGLLVTKPIGDRVRPSLKSPIEFEHLKGKEIEAGSISNRSTKRVRSSPGESDTSNENVPKKIKKIIIDLTSSPKESEELVVISSQTSYDSIPSQDLLDLPLPTNTTKSAVAVERSESDDEYGSFPSSPDLRALPY
jgi:hypothetical protein